MNGKKVVVTGAGGFIGSHLVEHLVEAGAHVQAFVRYKADLSIGALSNLPQQVLASLEVVRGDLRDLHSVERCLARSEYVFHLGALGSVPFSYENPLAFVEVNVVGTANVLECSRRRDVSRLIVMSSSEVYGSARYVPINEDHPLCAQSPYSATKIAAEKLTESFHRSYHSPVTVVRAFNTYGPRQSTRASIPSLVDQAIEKSVLKAGNLTPVRDFTYVTDVVRALVCLAVCGASHGKVINVGTGEGFAISDVIKLVGELIGKRLTTTQDAQRVRPATSEVDRLIADASLLRSLTGWSPEVDFRSGLAQVIEFMRCSPRRKGRYDF